MLVRLTHGGEKELLSGIHSDQTKGRIGRRSWLCCGGDLQLCLVLDGISSCRRGAQTVLSCKPEDLMNHAKASRGRDSDKARLLSVFSPSLTSVFNSVFCVLLWARTDSGINWKWKVFLYFIKERRGLTGAEFFYFDLSVSWVFNLDHWMAGGYKRVWFIIRKQFLWHVVKIDW